MEDAEWLARGASFGPAERADFTHGQLRTADSLVALIVTHTRIKVMPPAGWSALVAEIGEYLASRPETADGEFTLPMVTMGVRSLRR